jgi:lysozyme family protein
MQEGDLPREVTIGFTDIGTDYQRGAAYGVNSGTGRSGKVLRRTLGLPVDSSTVTDAVIAGGRAADPKILIAAICEERLRFLQALKTWPVFGTGWGRRVAEVKSTALKMAADAAKARTMGRNK